MSDKEVKTNNKELALAQVRTMVSKHKIAKLPVLINTVIKNVFGDLAKNEDKADRAYKLVSNLLNELVESGELSQFSFVRMMMKEGEATPSIINESIIVEGGFQLAGYVPADMVTDTQSATDEDDDVFEADEDDLNELLQKRTTAYAIVQHKEKGREIFVKNSPQAALGTYLNLAADESNHTELYAMVPVDLEITSTMAQPSTESNLADTPEEEAGESVVN